MGVGREGDREREMRQRQSEKQREKRQKGRQEGPGTHRRHKTGKGQIGRQIARDSQGHREMRTRRDTEIESETGSEKPETEGMGDAE